jgi:hypothetical protein
LELENLKELRELSAGLAGQMSVLEEKLATLSSGTEGMKQRPRVPADFANVYSSGAKL